MRRRCLPRPLHAVFCVLAMVLILGLVRVFCGPFPALSPEAALHRAERNSLLPPGEVEARWDRLDQTYLAVRQPDGAWRVWNACPSNTVTYVGVEMKPEHIRLLRFYPKNGGCTPAGSSWEVPWKGAAFFTNGWTYSGLSLHSLAEAHLLLENEDPAAVRAELSCMTVTEGEEPSVQKWTASAQRLTPRLFDLTLSLERSGSDDAHFQRRWDSLVTIAAGGYSPGDTGLRAEGTVLWYDAEGRELYRQELEFFEADDSGQIREEITEGGGEHGA